MDMKKPPVRAGGGSPLDQELLNAKKTLETTAGECRKLAELDAGNRQTLDQSSSGPKAP